MTILPIFFISNFKYSFSTYRIKSNSLSLTFHINLIVLTNNFYSYLQIFSGTFIYLIYTFYKSMNMFFYNPFTIP